MIIDEIAAVDADARALLDRSTIVMLPFRVTKRYTVDGEDGGWDEFHYLDGDCKRYLNPRVYEWCRAPLPSIVLVGNGGNQEKGFIAIDAASDGPMLDFFREKDPTVHTFIAAHVFLAGPAGGVGRFDLIGAFCLKGVVTFGMSDAQRLAKSGSHAIKNLIGPRYSAATVGADDHTDMFTRAVNSIMAAFSLMNCKNVDRTEAAIPDRVQEHRKRNGKLPLYRYHVLTLRPQSRRARGLGHSGLDMAIHWVRGHFKEYGKSGLFGKHRGIYWWSPHLAGTAARVVDKGYRLTDAPGRP